MNLNPIQRFLKAMRDSVNEGIKKDKVIDLQGAINAGMKSWDVCYDEDITYSIADLVYRHMITEQGDGNAIVLIGDDCQALKRSVGNQISKRCYWLQDWAESFNKKLEDGYHENDVVLYTHNECVQVTSNADIYDAQPGWYNLKIEYMSSSSRAKQQKQDAKL